MYDSLWEAFKSDLWALYRFWMGALWIVVAISPLVGLTLLVVYRFPHGCWR